MTLAVALFILGVLVEFGSFLVFMHGMVTFVKGDFGSKNGIDTCFYAMIGLPAGATLSAIGIVYGAWDIVSRYL